MKHARGVDTANLKLLKISPRRRELFGGKFRASKQIQTSPNRA